MPGEGPRYTVMGACWGGEIICRPFSSDDLVNCLFRGFLSGSVMLVTWFLKGRIIGKCLTLREKKKLQWAPSIPKRLITIITTELLKSGRTEDTPVIKQEKDAS